MKVISVPHVGTLSNKKKFKNLKIPTENKLSVVFSDHVRKVLINSVNIFQTYSVKWENFLNKELRIFDDGDVCWH